MDSETATQTLARGLAISQNVYIASVAIVAIATFLLYFLKSRKSPNGAWKGRAISTTDQIYTLFVIIGALSTFAVAIYADRLSKSQTDEFNIAKGQISYLQQKVGPRSVTPQLRDAITQFAEKNRGKTVEMVVFSPSDAFEDFEPEFFGRQLAKAFEGVGMPVIFTVISAPLPSGVTVAGGSARGAEAVYLFSVFRQLGFATNEYSTVRMRKDPQTLLISVGKVN